MSINGLPRERLKRGVPYSLENHFSLIRVWYWILEHLCYLSIAAGRVLAGLLTALLLTREWLNLAHIFSVLFHLRRRGPVPNLALLGRPGHVHQHLPAFNLALWRNLDLPLFWISTCHLLYPIRHLLIRSQLGGADRGLVRISPFRWIWTAVCSRWNSWCTLTFSNRHLNFRP